MELEAIHSRETFQALPPLPEQAAPVNRYCRWHAYPLEERHAPWKVFLPVGAEAPILAAGLDGVSLASLARSWKTVSVLRCADVDLRWAAEQGKSLGHSYRFADVGPVDALRPEYAAVAVGAGGATAMKPHLAFRLLKPGGMALWVGQASQVPQVSDLVQAGFAGIRRYAILPPGIGKLLIPLEDARCTHAGLDLYHPFKWRNRLLVRLGQIAAGFSCQALLGWKQVVLAQKPGRLGDHAYLLDWLGRRLPAPPVEMAVYTGWTKLVLQLLDREGRAVGFAKVADVGLGQHGIEQETEALHRLKNVGGLQGIVPAISALGEWGGHTVQVQTPVAAGPRKYTTRLTPRHREFLLALSRVDQVEAALEDWPHWREIWRWAHEGEFTSPEEAGAVRAAVRQCAGQLIGETIEFHRVHGDFTPWHALGGDEGLAVVDWEESEAMGLPMSDAVHFVLARDVHLFGKPLPVKKLLTDSPLSLGMGEELSLLAGHLHVPPGVARLAVLFELYRHKNLPGSE